MRRTTRARVYKKHGRWWLERYALGVLLMRHPVPSWRTGVAMATGCDPGRPR